MSRPEQELQRACIKWLRLQYPDLLAFHTPNGRNAGSPRMGKLWKDMGVVAGVPDILIVRRNSYWVGMAVELKSDKGRISESQLAMHEKFLKEGWYMTTIRSLDDFMRAVKEYMRTI